MYAFRISPWCCCLLAIVSTASFAGLLQAGEAIPAPVAAAPPGSLPAAMRNLELAELRLLRYDRVEYPLAQKRLERDIEMTKAEIASFERLVAEYEQFHHSAYTAPFVATLEDTRLALKEAELRLDLLLRERCLRLQYRGAVRRIHELEIEQARDWVDVFSHEKK
ncbi:MAG: hypothetical protein KDA42_06085 [Planctomycetales bacterium]|nr:hypothetical protein [Planctomycetales bacterium]